MDELYNVEKKRKRNSGSSNIPRKRGRPRKSDDLDMRYPYLEVLCVYSIMLIVISKIAYKKGRQPTWVACLKIPPWLKGQHSVAGVLGHILK